MQIALSQVGKVHTCSPPDSNGLWIHRDAAAVLDEKELESMRSAFTIELFNRRGVHSCSAGKEEGDLETVYACKAGEVDQAGHIRLASALRDLASS
jgi:hypothetical protein